MIRTEARSGQPRTRTTELDLRAVVGDLPWEIGFSKLPGRDEEIVEFASDEVGIMRHFVEVRPLYTNTGNLWGHRVTKRHLAQEEPTVVDECISSRDEAFDAARDCMERLTN